MNKYNAGDKFIIEVEEKCVGDFKTEGTTELYRIKGFNSLVFDKNGLDKLQKVNPKLKIEDIDDMLAEYDLKKESYEKGLQDAWELAKMVALEPDMIKIANIFIAKNICGIEQRRLFEDVFNFTPQEALAKIEAYEQEIKVGDVVELTNNEHTYCITYISPNNNIAGVCIETGEVIPENYEINIKQCKKTGRHIDIKRLLEEIGAN